MELLEPGVIVPLGEPQEKPLHLDAAALDQQFLQALRTERPQTLHQHVRLMESFALRNLIEQFQDRPLRRGERQRPIPLAPRLLNEAAAERMRSQGRLAPAFDAGGGMDGGMGVKEPFRIVKDELGFKL